MTEHAQDFFGDFLARLHADIERDPFAEASCSAQELICRFRGAAVEEAVAHQADGLRASHECALARMRSHELVGAPAAEESALAVAGDVNVEQAGQRVAGALDVAGIHAVGGEPGQDSVTQGVVSDAGDQAGCHSPLAKSQGAVGAYSSTVQLQVIGEAFLAWVRPGSGEADEVYVDVTEDQDPRFGGFFARHRRMVPPSTTAGRHFAGASPWICHTGC